MKKTFSLIQIVLFVIFSSVPSLAMAQASAWYETVEGVMVGAKSNGKMLCDYIGGSLRNLSVDDWSNDEGIALISARYDYRCADNTGSDTVYIAFSNNGRNYTCIAFQFFNKKCTLHGYKVDK